MARVVRHAERDGVGAAEAFTAAIAEIDRRLHAQVDEILKAPAFRRLEATWNSLEYLVAQKPRGSNIRIRVLNVSRDELQADIEDAIEFDRSGLFQLIYENEYGQFGGDPYGLLIADFEFSHAPEDIEILAGLAGVGAAAHAIVVAAAAPALMGLDSWSELSVRTLPRELEGPRYAAWRSLRESDDARYLGLTLPRMLLRAPYRPRDPDRTVRLRENSFARDGSGMLWGSAAFVLAARAMAAFHAFGWCTAIRGLTDDWGVAEGLPEISFETDRPGLAVAPPVEVAVTEAQEKTITELGLIPLCRIGGGPRLALFGIPSVHLPKRVDDPLVQTNLKLSARIPYMLAASRFAHYLKVIVRDHVGRFTMRGELEAHLSNWLSRYTLADDHATKAKQAEFPLRRFQVTVRERPGRPGHYEAITELQPHYQIEDPGVSLRLAVDLPDPDRVRR